MKKPWIFKMVVICVCILLSCCAGCVSAEEESTLELYYGSEPVDIHGNFTEGVMIEFTELDECDRQVYAIGEPESQVNSLADEKIWKFGMYRTASKALKENEKKTLIGEYVYEEGKTDKFWEATLICDSTYPTYTKIVLKMPGLDESLFLKSDSEKLKEGIKVLSGHLNKGDLIQVKSAIEGAEPEIIGSAEADEDNRFKIELKEALQAGQTVKIEITDATDRPLSKETPYYEVSAMEALRIELEEYIRVEDTSVCIYGQPKETVQWELRSQEESLHSGSVQIEENGECELIIEKSMLSEGAEYSLIVWYEGTEAEYGAAEEFTVDGICDVRLVVKDSNAELSKEDEIFESVEELVVESSEKDNSSVKITVNGKAIEGDVQQQTVIPVDEVPGAEIVIHIDDGHGNEVDYRLTVTKVTYEEIVIEQPEQPEEDVIESVFYYTEPSECICFSGTAQPEKQLRFKLKQDEDIVDEDTIDADADGKWNLVIERKKLEEGVRISFDIEYADGYMREAARSIAFIVDCTAPGLEMFDKKAAVYADSVLKGKTEADADVKVYSIPGEEVLYADKADENGDFEINLAQIEEIMIGKTLQIRVIDAAGNSTPTDYAISVKERVDLTDSLFIEGEEAERTIGAENDEYTLEGRAHRDESLVVSMYDEEIDEISVDADGRWEYTVSSTQLLNSKDGAEVTVRISYAEDKDNYKEAVLVVDGTCELMAEEAQEGTSSISGQADAYAEISVRCNGAEAVMGKADQTGRFEVKLQDPLKKQDQVIVVAEDEFGNRSQEEEIQIAPVTDAPLIIIDAIEPGNYCEGLEINGTAQPNMPIAVRAGEEEKLVVSDADGRFEAAFGKLEDGEIQIAASYDGYYEGYEAEKITVISDSLIPQLSIDQTEIDTNASIISGQITEAGVVVLISGEEEINRYETDAAFEFAVEPAMGTMYELYAEDKVGNRSEKITLSVKLPVGAIGQIEVPASGTEISYMDEMIISGWVLASGQIDSLKLIGLEQEIALEYHEDSERCQSLAREYDDQIEAAVYVYFNEAITLKNSVLGEKTLSLIAEVDGMRHEVLGEKISISIIKPENYLAKKVFLMTMLLSGLIILATIWVVLGRRITVLTDKMNADLEENDMNVQNNLNN